jgi:hypothetical protein
MCGALLSIDFLNSRQVIERDRRSVRGKGLHKKERGSVSGSKVRRVSLLAMTRSMPRVKRSGGWRQARNRAVVLTNQRAGPALSSPGSCRTKPRGFKPKIIAIAGHAFIAREVIMRMSSRMMAATVLSAAAAMGPPVFANKKHRRPDKLLSREQVARPRRPSRVNRRRLQPQAFRRRLRRPAPHGSPWSPPMSTCGVDPTQILRSSQPFRRAVEFKSPIALENGAW